MSSGEDPVWVVDLSKHPVNIPVSVDVGNGASEPEEGSRCVKKARRLRNVAIELGLPDIENALCDALSLCNDENLPVEARIECFNYFVQKAYTYVWNSLKKVDLAKVPCPRFCPDNQNGQNA